MLRRFPSTLITHCKELCGVDVTKWQAVLVALAESDTGSDVDDGGREAMQKRWDEVLRAAATTLSKDKFLSILPPEGNLRFFSKYIQLNQKLSRVHDCLRDISLLCS